jgi:hypothetical protein
MLELPYGKIQPWNNLINMDMERNIKIAAWTMFFLSGLSAKSALAVCPVCTLAVAGGLEISRWLGIDDVVTSLWIGALVVSMIMWTINWFNKKNIRFEGREILTTVGYYLLVIVPLYWMNNKNGAPIIGDPRNTFWGVDKVLLGIILGSILFFLSSFWYEALKKKNNGHSYFPYQKVAMPVASLLIVSVMFYFLTR